MSKYEQIMQRKATKLWTKIISKIIHSDMNRQNTLNNIKKIKYLLIMVLIQECLLNDNNGVDQ